MSSYWKLGQMLHLVSNLALTSKQAMDTPKLMQALRDYRNIRSYTVKSWKPSQFRTMDRAGHGGRRACGKAILFRNWLTGETCMHTHNNQQNNSFLRQGVS